MIAVLVLALASACQGGAGTAADAATCGDSTSGTCCRADEDCSGGAACATPGAPRGCGICQDTPGDCSADTDCDPGNTGMICEPVPCACSGQQRCTPGCLASPGDCPEGTRCGEISARCESLPCADGCPAHFECGELTRCVRADCQAAADCPGGHCVLGGCYATLGECRLPVP